jgi:hypothetical protein
MVVVVVDIEADTKEGGAGMEGILGTIEVATLTGTVMHHVKIVVVIGAVAEARGVAVVVGVVVEVVKRFLRLALTCVKMYLEATIVIYCNYRWICMYATMLLIETPCFSVKLLMPDLIPPSVSGLCSRELHRVETSIPKTDGQRRCA